MVVVSSSLARRVERAECQMLADIAGHVRTRNPGVLILPVGGGLAVHVEDGSPMNKLAGLGFEPLDEADLEQVEGEFERRRAPLQVEFSTLGDNALTAMLTRRGYVLTGFEDVLGCPLEGLRAGRQGCIEVRAVAAAEADEWAAVVVEGFAHPDTYDGPAPHESFPREALERAMSDIRHAPGFEWLVALRDGVVAGGASFRVFDGIAQLSGSATLPAHRRRGVQTALVRHRLAEAARRGCDLAVITTAPGSKSQENARRQGFELLYSRAILVRSWA